MDIERSGGDTMHHESSTNTPEESVWILDVPADDICYFAARAHACAGVRLHAARAAAEVLATGTVTVTGTETDTETLAVACVLNDRLQRAMRACSDASYGKLVLAHLPGRGPR